MSETPSTELDAVNVILKDMGEAPINSLGGDLPLDASKAQGTLLEISRATQSRGWFWNREIVRLAPDANNEVFLPSNTLSVKPAERLLLREARLTNRNGKLYRIEPRNNGFDFTEDQDLEITYFLPFVDIVEVARRYITIRAARIHQARELGDEMLLRNTSAEEQTAWNELLAEESSNSQRNLNQACSMQFITHRQGPMIFY